MRHGFRLYSFLSEILQYEEDKKMSYITSVEKIGMEKGYYLLESNIKL